MVPPDRRDADPRMTHPASSPVYPGFRFCQGIPPGEMPMVPQEGRGQFPEKKDLTETEGCGYHAPIQPDGKTGGNPAGDTGRSRFPVRDRFRACSRSISFPCPRGTETGGITQAPDRKERGRHHGGSPAEWGVQNLSRQRHGGS